MFSLTDKCGTREHKYENKGKLFRNESRKICFTQSVINILNSGGQLEFSHCCNLNQTLIYFWIYKESSSKTGSEMED